MPRKTEIVVETVEHQEEPERDEQADLLAEAARLMQKAATDKANRSATLKEAEKALGQLKIVDYPELAESPVVQAFLKAMGVGDLQPGQIANRGTLAEREREWSYRDMGQFPAKTFIPDETVPVTWNGLMYQLRSGEEVTVPEPIYNVYRDHKKAQRMAQQHEQYLLGHSDLPPDPSWLTDESAKVRLWSVQGRKYGKPSGFLGVGLLQDGVDAGEGADSA